jgi:2-polyprenyl-3-methyl-5-hydroxy-6-metoxy-1,4-benzoquinol methylase
MTDRDIKQAEIDYPSQVSEEGRTWLRNKPFWHDPRMTARLLIDFGYVLQILELHPGMSFCELGCGPGWMTRFAARHGLEAEGYDISPEMIEISRDLARSENVDATFEVGDMETLDLDRRFDACLIYDALHHSRRADLVLHAARRALKPGGRLLVSEPNWKHRFQGREASDEYGVTEMGYSPRKLKRMLKEAGFSEITRFHNNRKRLFSNSPLEITKHLAEPLVYRGLAPFWTQIWLRATAP